MRRQTKWKIKQYQKGNCINCGKPREKSPYKRTCIKCALKRRVRKQRRYREEPWVQGGRGRPPKAAKLGIITKRPEKDKFFESSE